MTKCSWPCRPMRWWAMSYGKMGILWNGACGDASQCWLSLNFFWFLGLNFLPKQSSQAYVSHCCHPQKAFSFGTRFLFCWRISEFIPLGGGFISSTHLLCDNSSKFTPLPAPQQLSVTDNLLGAHLVENKKKILGQLLYYVVEEQQEFCSIAFVYWTSESPQWTLGENPIS